MFSLGLQAGAETPGWIPAQRAWDETPCKVSFGILKDLVALVARYCFLATKHNIAAHGERSSAADATMGAWRNSTYDVEGAEGRQRSIPGDARVDGPARQMWSRPQDSEGATVQVFRREVLHCLPTFVERANALTSFGALEAALPGLSLSGFSSLAPHEPLIVLHL